MEEEAAGMNPVSGDNSCFPSPGCQNDRTL
jgi:hypothetical protein